MNVIRLKNIVDNFKNYNKYIKYTKETILLINAIQDTIVDKRWICFEKPTIEEFKIYYDNDDLDDNEIQAEYEYLFPFNKYYLLLANINQCLMLNSNIAYTPFTTDNYEIDLEDFYKTILDNIDNIPKDIPTEYKFGIVSRKEFYNILPKYKKEYLKNLKYDIKDIINVNPQNNPPLQITRRLFLIACSICYEANDLAISKNVIENYEKYADGRNDGLLKLNDSVNAFKYWMSENKYGHPFEIMRGGNLTHISLYPDEDKLIIRGEHETRSIETLNAYMLLNEKGIRTELYNKEMMFGRLLETDYIGILPNYIPFLYYCDDFKDLFDIDCKDIYHWYDLEEMCNSTQFNKLKKVIKCHS